MSAILLVDDETCVLQSLRNTLNQIGYNVFTARNVPEAIQVFGEQPIDLVLSDIYLGGESGLRLLDHLRKVSPEVPVIVFTGKPDLVTAIESVRRGAYDYLLKPITTEGLKSSVQRAIEYYRLLEQKKLLTEQNEDYRKELEKKNDELEAIIQKRTADLQNTIESLKQTQEKLIQSHKLESMSKLISGVAHELNNLLAPILLSAELLQETTKGETTRDSIETIIESVITARNIVLSLLSFARKDIPVRVLTDLNSVMRGTVELVEYQFRTNGIPLSLDLDNTLPEVFCNPGEMGQVFLNILNNARTAILEKGKGEVTVTSSKEGDRIAFRIRDTGIGIPEENMLKLFDPFFTTKEKSEKTGLGLSVCYGIVTSHGGEIRSVSCEGEWTEFTVELPIHPPDEDKIETASLKQSETRTELSPETVHRILIIDDEEKVCQRVRELMRTLFRADILTAANGQEALDMIQCADYDLILADIRMPGLDGIRLYRWLKLKDESLQKKFLFMTGEAFDAGIKEFLEKEGIPYVIKPFTTEELKEKLNLAKPRRKLERQKA
jgi:two-component system NtrC family sensor kinase